MPRRVAQFSLLVPDYDRAIAFFTNIGFSLIEDTDLGGGKPSDRENSTFSQKWRVFPPIDAISPIKFVVMPRNRGP